MIKIFYILGIIGIVIILILSFIIPNDPFMIIPGFTSFSFDKPLWLCISISVSFFYLMILYYIYDNFK